ncbi:MAG: hypothetical protein ACNS60_04910 [Candidatus Cyclobacteriaceae bacterium M2_1C_046]
MKKVMCLSVCMLVISMAAFSQETVQLETCENVKEGTYRLKHGLFNLFGKTYVVKRENDKQVEVDDYGDKYIFNVEWINDCTYKLKLQDILDDSSRIAFSDKPILVEIIEVTSDGYKNKVTMDIEGSTVVRTNMMIRANPQQYIHLNELLNPDNEE